MRGDEQRAFRRIALHDPLKIVPQLLNLGVIERHEFDPEDTLELVRPTDALDDIGHARAAAPAEQPAIAGFEQLAYQNCDIARRHPGQFDQIRILVHQPGGERCEIGGAAVVELFADRRAGPLIELGHAMRRLGTALIIGPDDDGVIELEGLLGFAEEQRPPGVGLRDFMKGEREFRAYRVR